jgi:hypothetical protein
MLTLKEVLPHFGNNQSELARALKLSRQGVNKWGKDDPIPEIYEWRLRYVIKPEVFGVVIGRS